AAGAARGRPGASSSGISSCSDGVGTASVGSTSSGCRSGYSGGGGDGGGSCCAAGGSGREKVRGGSKGSFRDVLEAEAACAAAGAGGSIAIPSAVAAMGSAVAADDGGSAAVQGVSSAVKPAG
ncbi:unnamed protein product, partial [Phaeothamnion confervicola]